MIKETTVDSWQFLNERLNCTPTLALILGSGLSRITDAVEERVTVEYAEIPGMGAGTVQGHSYQVVSGYLSGIPVVIFSGRFHYYEGYSLNEVTRPVRLAQTLGAQKLILTNSAGSLHQQLRPGFYTVITDHLLLMSGNPLRGNKNNGRRHNVVPMTNVYDSELRKFAVAEAEELDLRDKEGG
ncbi:purine-nucleoside phosphorylase, partial [bacterium]|nr:purine-nucleoside phosphorylase [bacterium]